MTDPDEILSPLGQKRRGEIGRLARSAARQRRRRRLAAGRSLVATCMVLIAAGAWSLRPKNPTVPLANGTPTGVTAPAQVVPPSAVQLSRVIITRINTDPAITERLSLGYQRPRWRMIEDDELLRTLADAGHPAGLIRINGQELLMTR